MKKSFLLILSTFASVSVFATHIIGGEMSYQYIGGDVYHFKLNLYRDCINGQAPFDNPATVVVYDASNNLVQTITVELLQDDTIPLSLSCTGIAPTICAEQGTYEFDVTLPPIAGGYSLAYQRCCRSGIIGNLAIPLEEGMTITATIPDPALATDNNSPEFSNYPPTAFCVGIPINFDHSATDADGDSLVYELCDGVAGADDINPMPVPALPPPYPLVTYALPYSGQYPFDANPSLAINANTGLITGTPSSIGVFTLGINVKEYRNGALIGEHRREMAEVYMVAGLPTPVDNPDANSMAVIYSVPASNLLKIICPSVDRIKEIKIFDIVGNLVLNEKVNQDERSLSVSLVHFNAGAYSIQLMREFSIQSQSFTVIK